jgi:hypothetical protein
MGHAPPWPGQREGRSQNYNEMTEAPTVSHSCGAKTSPVPRLDLLPLQSLVRLAARFEKGEKRYGRNNWRKGLKDREYALERAAHVLNHTLLLIEKLQGLRPDDGDDDAAAIMWGGAFLCEATFAMQQVEIKDAQPGLALSSSRDSSEVEQVAHNHQVEGSIPSPATSS